MNHEDRFDEAVRSIGETPIDPAVEAAAAARVRANLAAHEPIRGCAGFQALIPAYVAGDVPADRALLVKDHLHECVACRRFHDHARGKSAPKVAEMPVRRVAGPWRWAIAAAATVTVGLAAWEGFNRIPSEERARATLQSSQGAVLLVDDREVRPLTPGDVIPAGASIRTSKDATALVRLADGSLIESRERSEFSVAATRRDLNVQLARGSLIVEAAKQRSGHLYVTPRDCRVAVTGTVFSVSSGVKGSRVSVVEGQVEVEHAGSDRVLRPGQQYATSDSMGAVSVRDDIAWSARFTQHVALMQEVAVLGKAMEQLSQPARRYSSKLIDMLPADTAVYASIPNLGRSLEDALRVFRQRLAESPVLRQWWEKEVETGSGPSPEDLVVKIRRVSDYLGDEIVIAGLRRANGHMGEPVVIAEVRKPGLVEYVRAELTSHGVTRTTTLPLVVHNNVAIFAPDAAAMPVMTQAVERGQGGFRGTPFHAAVSRAYSDGAGMLLGVNFNSLCPAGDRKCGPSTILGGVKNLVVEQKDLAGQGGMRAVVTLENAAAGLAGFISEPGPMGAVDFFSPESTLLVALAVENPASVVDQMLALHPEMQQHFQEAQQELGLDIRNDIAGALGGEVAAGVDGPILPSPSWKFVAEVYNPSRLQFSIQKIADVAAQKAAQNNGGSIQLSTTTVNGRIYHSITGQDSGHLAEVHYTFVDGYLVAAPSRALVDAAIQSRQSQSSLARSTEFSRLVPRDPALHFSAVVYQNVGRALAPLAEVMQGAVKLDDDQQKALAGLTTEMKPTLVAFYREKDKVTVATTSSLLGLSNVFGLGSTMHLLEGIGRMRGTSPGKTSSKPNELKGWQK